MSHVPYLNKSCPRSKWVMSHIQINHVPYLHVLVHTQVSCSYIRKHHVLSSIMSHIYMYSYICKHHVLSSIMSHTYQVRTYASIMSHTWPQIALSRNALSRATFPRNSTLANPLSHLKNEACLPHENEAHLLHERQHKQVLSHMSNIWIRHVSRRSRACCVFRKTRGASPVSHVENTNESCLTCREYEWVMSHMSWIWMSHVSHVVNMNESCLTHESKSCLTYQAYECRCTTISHISSIWIWNDISHIKYMNRNWPGLTYEIYGLVMSRAWKTKWMGRASHMNQSHLTYETATHCNTLQQTTANCSKLQQTATPCNTLQHPATDSRTSS